MSITKMANSAYIRDIEKIKNQIEDNDSLNVRIIAKKIGISKSTLYKYLNNETYMPHDIYLAIVFLISQKNPA